MKDKKEIESQARAYLLNAGLNKLHVSRLENCGYFTAPASMRHHLNYPGGLIEHSINVTDNALKLGVFKDRADSFRFGMLHDLVKCYCYRRSRTGNSYVFVQAPYPGHGIASAFLAADFGIDLTPEVQTCIIFHMGAFGLDEDELKEYHAALARFPRALILSHAADHLASAFESRATANELNDEAFNAEYQV